MADKNEKREWAIKVNATEEIEALVRKRATAAGCSRSDLVLDMICMHLYGVTFGEHVADRRRSALQPQGAEVVQIRSGA